MMIPDGRPRGEWHPTPGWLRILFGKPVYRRAVYAHWQIGGGWDGWEYSEEPRP